MGLLTYEGRVLAGGLDPRRQRLELARELAYVPQVAPSLAATVAELVAAVGSLRHLDRRVLQERAEALGLDWPAIATVPFRRLSGGMKQKLLIALALSSGARLLVLDEPTASLDAETRETFFRMTGELADEITIVLCSHRLDEMRHLIDHVVCLDEGRVAFDGPAHDFLRTRARSVIEAQIHRDAPVEWLRLLGFHSGHGGWWRKTVDQAEKIELLPRLAGKLDGSLANLHVRDLESIATDERGDGSGG